jgi:hypothetical protein
MLAVAHLGDRVLGGAEQLDDLWLELREIAQDERDRIGTVVALGDGGVARALGAAMDRVGRGRTFSRRSGLASQRAMSSGRTW